jgi:hypothetical protein
MRYEIRPKVILMTTCVRKKIIRPLYPISLAVLGLAFAFHFGEIRGTVAVSSDSETSEDNYFQAAEWKNTESQNEMMPAGLVAGDSIGADISGGENSAGQNLSEDIIDGEAAPGILEDLSGVPAVAGEEVTADPAPPQEPAEDSAENSGTETSTPPAEPQTDDGTVEDNAGN